MTATFTRLGKVVLDDEASTFADDDNPFDILSWMGRPVELVDGTTIRDILICLSPWKAVVEQIVGMDFDAWLVATAKPAPELSDDPRERIVRVEVRPFISVDRHDDSKLADVCVTWDVFGVLEQPDEADGVTFDVVGLSLRHPSAYASLPLVIKREAEVSDIMTLGSTAMEPAIHPTGDDGVRGFITTPTVVNTVLYGLLGELASGGSPEVRDEKAASIVRSVQAALSMSAHAK
jgi:hypothetical protein